MRDRQVFDVQLLRNGVHWYHYPAEADFAIIHIMLPVGHAHNTGETAPGTAHFLEHMGANHSKRYPLHNSFGEWIGLQGGYNNAYTDNFHTVYIVEIPVAQIEEAWAGLFSQAFEPLFLEEYIALQRNIIISERRRRERWFPGYDELGHYVRAEWQHVVPVGLRQMYGQNPDLDAAGPEHLRRFHSHYFDTRALVLSAGPLEVKRFAEQVAALPADLRYPPENYEIPYWHRKDYHEVSFRDVTQPILYVGGLTPGVPEFETKVAVEFIGQLLTNSDHGPLYKWLRQEKGWVYGLSFKTEGEKYLRWRMKIPLQDLDQVDVVRKELWNRIEGALKDRALLGREVDRRLGAQTFHFQTLESVISGAEYDLQLYGQVTSEEVYRSILQKCRDAAYIWQIAEEYFSPKVRGEFCALPEE